jgi:hypothetical protein
VAIMEEMGVMETLLILGEFDSACGLKLKDA